MIYPITIIGHPVLRKVAKDIDKDYKDFPVLLEDMFATMYKSDGIGLAAPQIGLSIRLFVIDISVMADDEDEENLKEFKKVFINAKIVERSGEIIPYEEGCLSIPNVRENVKRENKIRIQYYDENFEYHDEEFEGTKARVIQHEYDHLDGKLFVDHISAIRKRLLRSKLTAISKGKFRADYKFRLA